MAVAEAPDPRLIQNGVGAVGAGRSVGSGWRLVVLGAILLLLISVLHSTDFLIIPSDSMAPTLRTGARVAISTLPYGLRVPLMSPSLQLRSPRRGELVVARSPMQDTVLYIKRVAAVSGDHVAIIGGAVFINGSRVESSKATADCPPDRSSVGKECELWWEHLGDTSYLTRRSVPVAEALSGHSRPRGARLPLG